MNELSIRYNAVIREANLRGDDLGQTINGKMIVGSDITELFKGMFDDCSFDDAITLDNQFSKPIIKDLYLQELSSHYIKKDLIESVRKVALPKFFYTYNQDQAKKELCLGLIERGDDVKEVEKFAKTIDESMTKESTLSKMSIALFKKGQVVESLELALRIPSPGYRLSALWCLREDASKDKNFDIKYPGVRDRIFEGMSNNKWLSIFLI